MGGKPTERSSGGGLSAGMSQFEPVVITGIGLITSVGTDRESVWQAVCQGRSGVKRVGGLQGIPDDTVLGAPVEADLTNLPGDINQSLPPDSPQRTSLKVIRMAEIAAAEAMADANLHPLTVCQERFGCAISGHVGDTGYVFHQAGRPEFLEPIPWYLQFVPNTGCHKIANFYGLRGPRLAHSVACASGAVELLSAVRAIQDDQCDLCLTGSTEIIHPLFAAGFRRMGVLANHDDPTAACRPFDSQRTGFVMGEGSGMLIVERLSHALQRGARIYCEVVAGKMFSDGMHVTNLDAQSQSLTHTIKATLRQARLAPDDIGYINVHGTGTQQNDLCESVGIRSALGRAANSIPVSAIKSMLGHLVNAAGSVETAITALALRDGFMPPTANLTDPDPECQLSHLPLVGRHCRPELALKLSVAFGGHLVAVVLRRWNDARSGFAYPGLVKAA